MTLDQEIAGIRWLFLVSLNDVDPYRLHVTVIEAHEGEVGHDKFGHRGSPIEPHAESRAFDVVWSNYVAFHVRSECFIGLPTEVRTGWFGSHKQSAYLDYIAAATSASDAYPGPLTHWYLCTESHWIDVVTVDPPEIRRLTSSEVGRIVADGTTGQTTRH